MPASEFAWGFKAQGARETTVLLGILEKLDNILGVLTRREKQTAQAFNSFKQTINQTSNTVNKYSSKVDKSTTIINKFGAQTQKTKKRTRSFFQTLTRAAGIWNTWNKAVDFAAKRIKQFTGLMTGWEKSLRNIGGAFERSEATLRVLAKSAGSSAEDIDKLVETTKKLGRETEFTAGQAATGAITLLKAGNTASESVNKLEAALDAALATGLDFAKAAKVGNYAWNIFGKNLGKTGNLTKDYSTALKIMIASANSADVTVEQLSGSLTNGGNILADLGVSLTRTTTALGLLANRGVVGRKAMRMLAISVKRLVDGTIPAEKALKILGITTVDQSGNLKDLGVLMEEIGGKLDLRAPNEQVRLMKQLFGAGDKVMRTLLDAGIKGFNELESSIEGALGTMEEMKTAKTDTIVGAWKQFKSAVEGVWVELVAVLRVPVIEYWNNLASILRKVSARIEKIGQQFKKNGKTLKDWIELVKTGGIEGLFQGLPQELEPEIQKLEELWRAFVQAVSGILKEIWDTFMSPEVLERMKGFARSIGEAIAEGIKAGIGEETFEKLVKIVDVAGTAAGAIGTIAVKGKEAFVRSVEAMSPIIEKGVVSAEATALRRAVPGKRVIPGREEVKKEVIEYGVSEEEKERRKELPAYKRTAAYQRMVEYTRSKKPEEEVVVEKSKEKQRIIGKEVLRESEDELKAKQEVLSTQQQLADEEKRYKEALEESKNILNETNVAINEIGSSFEQWLLNPVDVFKQKLMGVKETFGDLIDGLQRKKIDLAEKFGLKTAEEALTGRRGIEEKALQREERLLKLAQTPEEEMRIRERMAGRAAGLAEMAEGPEQQKYAQKTQEFLDQAAAAAAKAEELEIKRLEIQRGYAEKNIAEYEAMVGQAETAGGKAAALELAQKAYMTLGPEYAEKAAKATEELKVSKAEAAAEEAERIKKMAENSTTQVELLTRMVELAQEQLSNFRTQTQIPQNTEYADETG